MTVTGNALAADRLTVKTAFCPSFAVTSVMDKVGALLSARLPVPWLTAIRHYGSLARTAGRLDRLLGQFRFTAIAP